MDQTPACEMDEDLERPENLAMRVRSRLLGGEHEHIGGVEYRNDLRTRGAAVVAYNQWQW